MMCVCVEGGFSVCVCVKGGLVLYVWGGLV